MSAADFVRERERFPVLAERTFLAMQCLGAFPREMYDDLDEYKRTLALRNRAIEPWIERMNEMTSLVARLLDVPSDDVMLRDSATAAHAAIASAISPRPGRDRIVVSSADFHSTRYLWQAQRARGFELVVVPGNGPEHAFAETYTRHIDERTAIVALSLVSPRSGALLEALPIAQKARASGAHLILDAYQAVGVVPVHPRTLGADVVVGGTHKWLGSGGMGLAFAWVAPELSSVLSPAYPGWIGHRALSGFTDTYEPAPGAQKFQQGTPALEPIYTARAGIRWVLEVGIEALRARSIALTARLVDAAESARLPLRTPREPERRGGMVILDVPDANAIAERLREQAIDVDARPGAGLRLGPHPCVSVEECDRAIAAVAAALHPTRT